MGSGPTRGAARKHGGFRGRPADSRHEGSRRWALAQTGPGIVDFQVGGCFELDSSLTVSEPFLPLDGSNPALYLESGGPISHADGARVQGDEISYRKNSFACFKIRGPQLAAPPAGTRVRSAAVNHLAPSTQAPVRGGTPRAIPPSLWCGSTSTGTPASRRPRISKSSWRKSRAPAVSAPPREDDGHDRDLRRGQRRTAAPARAGLDETAGVRTDLAPGVLAKLRRERPPFNVTPLDLLPAEAVAVLVLAKGGATLPRRDATDERRLRQDRAGPERVILSQDDVGGYGLQPGGRRRRTPSRAWQSD